MSQRSYKRTRTEMTPSQTTLGLLKFEKATHPVVKSKVYKGRDTETTYAGSEPKGKNRKDFLFNIKDITNIMCPKWSCVLKSYGMNFAGGHRNDDQYGGVKTAFGLNTSTSATDGLRFALDDYRNIPQGWCDTVGWDAGTQAWFESVFLPATWRPTASPDLETTYVKNQCSMEGIIEMAWNILTGARENNAALAHSTENTNDAKKNDFAIHYNGGSQTHYFQNTCQHRVMFEAYEVIPRDSIVQYFNDVTRTNTRTLSNSIADLATADYVNRLAPASGGLSASTAAGSYTSSLGGTTNANGQIICRKEDPGFRLAPWQDTVHRDYRVSKGTKGSIEPGGKLVYTLKTAPFKIMNSAYRRMVKTRQNDTNPTNDNQFNNDTTVHLVPLFSKILVVRFWSEMSPGTLEVEKVSTVDNPYNFQTVASAPGRLIHYMVESHEARAVPSTPAITKLFKDFTKLDFDQTQGDFNAWKAIDDENDVFVTMQ